jgi:hypothetical protein
MLILCFYLKLLAWKQLEDDSMPCNVLIGKAFDYSLYLDFSLIRHFWKEFLKMATIPSYNCTRYSEKGCDFGIPAPPIPARSPVRSLSLENKVSRPSPCPNNSFDGLLPNTETDVNSSKASKVIFTNAMPPSNSPKVSVESSYPNLKQTPALTPMSDGYVLSADTFMLGGDDDRFIFAKPKPESTGWFRQIIGRIQKQGDTRKRNRVSRKRHAAYEVQVKSQKMMSEAREKMKAKRPTNMPMWLTDEETRLIEDRRRQNLGIKLGETLNGDHCRSVHRLDTTFLVVREEICSEECSKTQLGIIESRHVNPTRYIPFI